MLRIIEYTDKYKEKVVEFLINIILNELNMQENKEYIKNFDYNIYKKNGGNFWIAIDENNEVKATVGIENDFEKKQAKLVRVYLDSEYRGTGIASQMLQLAIEFVKQMEYDKIILGTYENLGRAVKFYEKNGFQEYKTENINDNIAKYYLLNI